MNNVLVVSNFNAGRKTAIKNKKKVLDFLIKRVNTFKFVGIDELNTIDVSAFDTIITMGGDGTVNRVLPYLINTDKILGIIPCGTANLLAARLGISTNIDKALKIIENQNINKIDCLDINGNLCILRCGFGYDADIICKTPQSLKNKFGYFAYFIAGIIFALRLKQKEYKLHIDDETLKTQASCIIISNAANMYKNFFTVGKHSKLDDGLIDVFIMNVKNPISFFFEFVKIGLNIKRNTKKVRYFQAQHIEIENNWTASHIDGEKKNIQNNIHVNINKNSIKTFKFTKNNHFEVTNYR